MALPSTPTMLSVVRPSACVQGLSDTEHQLIVVIQLEEDKVEHKRLFPADDHHLPQLVNHWAYSDEIASYFGAKPNLVRWFFRNPFAYDLNRPRRNAALPLPSLGGGISSAHPGARTSTVSRSLRQERLL